LPPIKEERPSEDREHQQCDNRETYQDDDKRTVLAIRILSHALKYPWALKSSGLIIVPSSAVVVQVAPPPKGGGQGEKSSCATRTRDNSNTHSVPRPAAFFAMLQDPSFWTFHSASISAFGVQMVERYVQTTSPDFADAALARRERSRPC
jgi:hypothetical protein